MRRIVVTGMGAVSPLGVGVKHNWNRLVNNESGIRAIDRFDTATFNSKIAGMVPSKDEIGGFNPESVFSGKEIRRNDPFILYAMAAADEALKQAAWAPEDELGKERTGVVVGSGIGGFQTITKGAVDYNTHGRDQLSAFFIPGQLINLASGQIAIRYGFFGPDYSVVGACATGAEAIASGARSILIGEADVMVVGGSDATIHPVAFAGFEKIHTLSTGFNGSPEQASRPFDRDRDGFVMGEGAGILVLEEYEHARARGAEILAELKGFASASDAHHVAASHPEGLGERRAIGLALDRAKMNPDEIDYLNAHATSTPVGDSGEMAAIMHTFGTDGRIAVSSTKSAIGHTFGAAGTLEAIYSVCALLHQVVPPTLNLDNPDDAFAGMNMVPHQAQELPIRAVLSNSFGFGATKVALVFTAA